MGFEITLRASIAADIDVLVVHVEDEVTSVTVNGNDSERDVVCIMDCSGSRHCLLPPAGRLVTQKRQTRRVDFSKQRAVLTRVPPTAQRM